jgi:hypothetical protein
MYIVRLSSNHYQYHLQHKMEPQGQFLHYRSRRGVSQHQPQHSEGIHYKGLHKHMTIGNETTLSSVFVNNLRYDPLTLNFPHPSSIKSVQKMWPRFLTNLTIFDKFDYSWLKFKILKCCFVWNYRRMSIVILRGNILKIKVKLVIWLNLHSSSSSSSSSSSLIQKRENIRTHISSQILKLLFCDILGSLAIWGSGATTTHVPHGFTTTNTYPTKNSNSRCKFSRRSLWAMKAASGFWFLARPRRLCFLDRRIWPSPLISSVHCLCEQTEKIERHSLSSPSWFRFSYVQSDEWGVLADIYFVLGASKHQ